MYCTHWQEWHRWVYSFTLFIDQNHSRASVVSVLRSFWHITTINAGETKPNRQCHCGDNLQKNKMQYLIKLWIVQPIYYTFILGYIVLSLIFFSSDLIIDIKYSQIFYKILSIFFVVMPPWKKWYLYCMQSRFYLSFRCRRTCVNSSKASGTHTHTHTHTLGGGNCDSAIQSNWRHMVVKMITLLSRQKFRLITCIYYALMAFNGAFLFD